MKKFQNSTGVISFLQATGIVAYVSLVATVMSRGNELFGSSPNQIVGPITAITLFSVSALICAILSLGYPFLLFWEHKKTREALTIVILTALWLVLFIICLLIFTLIKNF